jgi:hypothetical protein
MDGVIRDIGSFGLSLALGGGPLAVLFGLIALVNRRDRRQARLLALAARQLTGEAVRGEIAIEARCPLLAGGGLVRVDTCGLQGGVARQVVERLRQTLPPIVRLAVEGAPDPAHPGDLLGKPGVLRARPS